MKLMQAWLIRYQWIQNVRSIYLGRAQQVPNVFTYFGYGISIH